MSTQQLILFLIINELNENYLNFPRLIIFENLIDLKGNKIYKTPNLQFIEYDSIIKSKTKKIYDNKYPLILQKCYLFKNNEIEEIKVGNNDYFNIDENNIYFFEVKTSLDSLDNSKLEEMILNLIKNFQIFYETFINKQIFEIKINDVIPNIILIYDFHKKETDIYKFLYKQKKKFKYPFKLEIIYCFPNYPYFSFSQLKKNMNQIKQKLNETEQKLKDTETKLKNTETQLNQKLSTQEEEIKNLKAAIEEIKKNK